MHDLVYNIHYTTTFPPSKKSQMDGKLALLCDDFVNGYTVTRLTSETISWRNRKGGFFSRASVNLGCPS